jgi:hypothetical protein
MEDNNNAAAMRYVNFKVFRFILRLLKLLPQRFVIYGKAIDQNFVLEMADKI